MKSAFDFLSTILDVGFGTIIAAGVFAAWGSQQPRDNPLRILLGAVCTRLAATIGLGILALPLQIVPALDVSYDTLSILFLFYYWGSLAYQVFTGSMFSEPMPSNAAAAVRVHQSRDVPAPASNSVWRTAGPLIDAPMVPETFYDTKRLH